MVDFRSIKYLISIFLSASKLSDNRKCFTAAITKLTETKSYKHAKDNKNWIKTSEIEALERTNTWTLVTLPTGKHCIGCKWVYKINHKSDGTMVIYKARLVEKGYTQ